MISYQKIDKENLEKISADFQDIHSQVFQLYGTMAFWTWTNSWCYSPRAFYQAVKITNHLRHLFIGLTDLNPKTFGWKALPDEDGIAPVVREVADCWALTWETMEMLKDFTFMDKVLLLDHTDTNSHPSPRIVKVCMEARDYLRSFESHFFEETDKANLERLILMEDEKITDPTKFDYNKCKYHLTLRQMVYQMLMNMNVASMTTKCPENITSFITSQADRKDFTDLEESLFDLLYAIQDHLDGKTLSEGQAFPNVQQSLEKFENLMLLNEIHAFASKNANLQYLRLLEKIKFQFHMIFEIPLTELGNERRDEINRLYHKSKYNRPADSEANLHPNSLVNFWGSAAPDFFAEIHRQVREHGYYSLSQGDMNRLITHRGLVPLAAKHGWTYNDGLWWNLAVNYQQLAWHSNPCKAISSNCNSILSASEQEVTLIQGYANHRIITQTNDFGTPILIPYCATRYYQKDGKDVSSGKTRGFKLVVIPVYKHEASQAYPFNFVPAHGVGGETAGYLVYALKPYLYDCLP